MIKNENIESGNSIFQDDDADDLEDSFEEEESKSMSGKNSSHDNKTNNFMSLSLEPAPGETPIDAVKNTPAVIDLEKEVFMGNFEPLLLVLKNNLVDKNHIDSMGFGFLHQAASHDQQAIAKYLIEEKTVEVDQKSKNLQTPLMVATNYGRIPLIKYFIDRKADINARDSTNFSPLLYAVKQNEIAAFIYLLFVGADPDARDHAGCGVVHWAAYKNNLWLLKLLKTLGFNMEERDTLGFTALHRAIDNNAFECVAFLLDIYSIELLKTVEVEKIESKSIKNLFARRLKPKGNLQSYLQGQKAAYITYLFLGLALFLDTHSPVSEISNDFLFICFAFYSLLIYFFFYASWFILKVTPASNYQHQLPTISLETVKNLSYGVDFTNLDKAIRNFSFSEAERTITINESFAGSNLDESAVLNNITLTVEPLMETLSKFTFLHRVSAMIEKNQYQEIYEFDFDRCCPTCIKSQSEKTYHCDICGACIPYFYFHSKFFNKCFSIRNHVYYVFLLFFQQMILLIYLFIQLARITPQLKGPNIFCVAEIAYRNWINDSKPTAIVFAIFMILLFYNSLFLFINIYVITQNLTYAEFFNRHKFRYLFTSKLFKDDRVLNYYNNKNDKGLIINILYYFKMTFSKI